MSRRTSARSLSPLFPPAYRARQFFPSPTDSCTVLTPSLSNGRVKIFVKKPKFRVSVYLSSGGRGSKMTVGLKVFFRNATFRATPRLKFGG